MGIDFATNTIHTLINKLAGLVLGIASSILLVRGLSVEDFGRYNLLITFVTSLATIFIFGQHASNVYLISRKTTRAPYLISATLLYSIIAGIFIPVVIHYFGLEWINKHYNADLPAEVTSYIILLFPAVLLASLAPSFLRGLYMIRQFNLMTILQPILKIIFFSIFIWIFHGQLNGALKAFLLVNAIIAIAAFSIAVKRAGMKFDNTRVYFNHSLSYGSKAFWGELAGLGRDSLVIIVLGQYLPLASVGFFVLAKNLASLVNTVNQSISVPLFPRLSRERGGDKALLATRVIRFSFWISIAASILAAFLLPILIPLVYGRQYEPSVLIFLFLLPGTAAYAVIDILTTYFMSAGLPLSRMWTNFALGFMTISMLLAALEIYGSEISAAISISLAGISMMFFILLYFKNILSKDVLWSDIFLLSSNDFLLVKDILHNFTSAKTRE